MTMNVATATCHDWDNNVIDVILVIDGEQCFVKGFDDTEWKECEEYVEELSRTLGVICLGDIVGDY